MHARRTSAAVCCCKENDPHDEVRDLGPVRPKQARAVVDGLPGDIVALALPLDVDKIEEAGLITSDWRARLPNRAVVAESVVALVTRPGNPKGIRGWDDLTRCAVLRGSAVRLPCTMCPWRCIAAACGASCHVCSRGHGRLSACSALLTVPFNMQAACLCCHC